MLASVVLVDGASRVDNAAIRALVLGESTYVKVYREEPIVHGFIDIILSILPTSNKKKGKLKSKSVLYLQAKTVEVENVVLEFDAARGHVVSTSGLGVEEIFLCE